MGWEISTEQADGTRQRWFLVANFGGGLYCDQATKEDVNGYPTKTHNLVKFRCVFFKFSHFFFLAIDFFYGVKWVSDLGSPSFLTHLLSQERRASLLYAPDILLEHKA